MERRLAAILAADVVGYSKLVQADETATLTKLKSIWTDVFEVAVGEHRGRIFKMMGDGALAEFASVVDAVECGVAIQTALRERNAEAPGAPLEFRIGINLGDIVVDGDDVLGDGVNVAARLEAAAPPSGLLASDLVHSQVRGKVGVNFIDAGEINLKNIDGPLQVWRWEGEPVHQTNATEGGGQDRLTIAVLPFDNMSADPEQEFLADGLSEDIITGLSKVRWFLVIARNSTFTYKGQAVDVKRIAQELGVRYVLEGSVRKAGNRIRVTAQLIDATTGRHVWADRYDRELADIFDLQDEITRTIVARVEPEVAAAERDRAVSRASSPATENLDAWESYQRGLWHMWNYDLESYPKAHELLARATELDPDFATAHGYRSYAYYQGVIMGWAEDPEKDLSLGMEAARRALQIDDQDPVGYFAIGRIHMMQGDHDASIAALEESIRLNPSYSQAYHGLGMALVLSGRLDEARTALKQSDILSPRDPILWASFVVHALADVLAGDTESALLMARRALQLPRSHGYWPHAVHAAALVQAGRVGDAKHALTAAIEALPSLSATFLRSNLPTKQPDGLAPYLDALRVAGLPE